MRVQLLARYCELGWRIFPCAWLAEDGTCSCPKGSDCDDRGRHAIVKWQHGAEVREGENDFNVRATSDFEQVARWHQKWPRANWGWSLDDHFVVDIDKRHGGMETLALLDENDPDFLIPTLVQETPGGGRHFVYHQPLEDVNDPLAGKVKTLSQGRLQNLPGFEIKGRRSDGEPGSIVYIPPSVGRRWQGDLERVDYASGYLLQRIYRAKQPGNYGAGTGGSEEEFDWGLALTPGGVLNNQDDTLYRASRSLRALDVPDRLAIPLLRTVVSFFTNTDASDPWELDKANEKWERAKNEVTAGKSSVELTEVQLTLVEGFLKKRYS
ncbi:bifunctional DNA primase/polymerase [Umezawaea endophytica]|uniref:Bifunctional DNA primase/polymerase n=1 Tax=Umezawaea endophytica TaxID=1654476 RepID=A0A9X3AEN0_9PSEU|nr:bifunctional DNA primase/polymerase [Umezawaea endophytica]MCS7477497.1 bifunctional DNA primase/polymerase [Umezawaea endophytica]